MGSQSISSLHGVGSLGVSHAGLRLLRTQKCARMPVINAACMGIQEEACSDRIGVWCLSSFLFCVGALLQENEDGSIDPVHNGIFSYAYYHAIIVQGGRNDLD